MIIISEGISNGLVISDGPKEVVKRGFYYILHAW